MRRTILVSALLLAVLPVSEAGAQTCDEIVTIEVTPGTISMQHDQALFNCCAWLDIEAVQSPGLVEFFEREMFNEGPCYCLCCFDASAIQSGIEPGEYTVRVWKALNNLDGTWTMVLAYEGEVVVTGYSTPQFHSAYVPCAQSTVEGPDLGTSWGTIKALYR